MKSDLHIHSLGDKYADDINIDDFSKVVLDDDDKNRIRTVVDWCCHNRGLDAVALTDHDMIQGSLYAAEYVKLTGLPIKIITGAECTVFDDTVPLGKSEVHLLCLGIDELPQYDRWTPVPTFIRRAHQLGAFVIMSHPIDSPDSFKCCWHLLDGYEYKNGHRLSFDKGKRIIGHREIPIAFCNSDFHYEGGDLPTTDLDKLNSNYYEVDPLRG